MDRRDFFKTSAAAAAVGGAGLSGRALEAAVRNDQAITADVLVIGAGASGVPAAIAAARSGVKVCLIEEDLSIGGAPVDMYVTMLCGWPRIGIFREIVDRLQKQYHLLGRPVKQSEERRDIWFLPSTWQRTLVDFINAEPNITLICGARAKDAIVSADRRTAKVKGAVIETFNGGSLRINAKVTIDATGSGAFSERAGCRVMYGRESKSDFGETHAQQKRDNVVMPCTWMYISQAFSDKAKEYDLGSLRGANESGYGWVSPQVEKANERKSGIYLHWGATVLCDDTRDPAALGKAQVQALAKLHDTIDELFENGFAVHLSPHIGVRECRRVKGMEVVTENSLKKGVIDGNSITIGKYYLDVWGQKLSYDEKSLPTFGIPYGALVPEGTEGMLTCGKIISGTHIAMSAYRVQPIVAQMGQAAGLAAAMCVKGNLSPAEVSTSKLQHKLKQTGVDIEEYS